MKVKNINGTSDGTCQCGSWLDHWKKFSGQKLPTYCAKYICPNKPEVGAHVQKDNSTDTSWYIVPLCKTHNAETGKSVIINDLVKLVPADVGETCGKKDQD